MLDPSAPTRIRRFGGDALLRKLIDLFRTSGPEGIADIRDALLNDDLVTATRAAHSLKSSAGNLGLTYARMAAEEIELCLRDRDVHGAQEALPRLEEQVHDGLKKLHDICPPTE